MSTQPPSRLAEARRISATTMSATQRAALVEARQVMARRKASLETFKDNIIRDVQTAIDATASNAGGTAVWVPLGEYGIHSDQVGDLRKILLDAFDGELKIEPDIDTYFMPDQWLETAQQSSYSEPDFFVGRFTGMEILTRGIPCAGQRAVCYPITGFRVEWTPDFDLESVQDAQKTENEEDALETGVPAEKRARVA